MNRRTLLQATLVVTGAVSLLLYPLMLHWPSGWAWTPHQHEYQQMLVAVYAVLGIFLILAARRPEDHRSLIWFTVWSSLAHAAVMTAQALGDASERGHLVGDIPALVIAAVLLAVLAPRSRSEA